MMARVCFLFVLWSLWYSIGHLLFVFLWLLSNCCISILNKVRKTVSLVLFLLNLLDFMGWNCISKTKQRKQKYLHRVDFVVMTIVVQCLALSRILFGCNWQVWVTPWHQAKIKDSCRHVEIRQWKKNRLTLHNLLKHLILYMSMLTSTTGKNLFFTF